MGETRQIGRYAVVRLLGKGGMSEVYEVENLRLGSRHALKLFTYEKDDPEVRERFLTEGKLLARLSHPRIVKVSAYRTSFRVLGACDERCGEWLCCFWCSRQTCVRNS